MFVTAIREDCRRGRFEEETCRRQKPVETSCTPRILEGFLISLTRSFYIEGETLLLCVVSDRS